MSAPKTGEEMIFALRALYDGYGYSRYRMNKFEEYDLYARNKDFLAFEGIITFTDTNGKLMALKPDVTLSIIKNTREQPGVIQKMYYNENVYRVARGSRSFREIMQVGLEAIGAVDDYCILEVLTLAAESLIRTGRDCVLTVSHLGLLSEMLRASGVPAAEEDAALRFVAARNAHELAALCGRLGLPQEDTDRLLRLTALYGEPAEALPILLELTRGTAAEETALAFARVLSALAEAVPPDMLRVDFSIVSDPRYYSGFVFKGFAEGLPDSVLSGGQYDRLMREMRRESGAVGFAVYLDRLEQPSAARAEYDVDDLLLYDGASSLSAVARAAEALRQKGDSVLALRAAPPEVSCRRIVRMTEGEVSSVEDRA